MILAQLALGPLPEAAAVGIDDEGISIRDAGPERAPEGAAEAAGAGRDGGVGSTPTRRRSRSTITRPPSRCRAPSSLVGQASRHRFAMATW